MINIKDIVIRDPFILVDGDDYYLYGTHIGGKDPCYIGYHSKDLISFDDPKVIFKRNDDFWATKDYWAPEVHKYKGKYYLFASLKSEDRCRGTQIFVSDNPLGVYTPLTDNPITPHDWECLDGTLYVENERPYLIFCREWLEVNDGEMYIVELTSDLKGYVSEPKLMFKASEARWVKPLRDDFGYVTDGPFIIKENGWYYMLWSSFSKNGYTLAICKSESLHGPWQQLDEPIFDKDGGHGMIFEKNGIRYVAFHAPNDPRGAERTQIVPFAQLYQL